VNLTANPAKTVGPDGKPIGSDTNGPIYGLTPTNNSPLVPSTSYTNNIIWQNNDTTAARDATLKTGFGMIGEGVGDIISAIDRNTLATMQGGNGTNGYSDSLAGDVLTSITNQAGDYQLTNDWAITESGARQKFTDAVGDSMDNLNSLGNLNVAFGEGPGTPSAGEWQIGFYKSPGVMETLDLHPDSWLSNYGYSSITNWLFGATALLAVIIFVGDFGKQCLGLAKTFATAQMGKVPNVSVFGTNVQGVVLTLAIALLFVALWVAVFDTVFSVILGTNDTILGLINSLPSRINSTTSGFPSGQAWSLVKQCFPVSLICSLAFTRAMMSFLFAQYITVCAGISRFFVGG